MSAQPRKKSSSKPRKAQSVNLAELDPRERERVLQDPRVIRALQRDSHNESREQNAQERTFAAIAIKKERLERREAATGPAVQAWTSIDHEIADLKIEAFLLKRDAPSPDPRQAKDRLNQFIRDVEQIYLGVISETRKRPPLPAEILAVRLFGVQPLAEEEQEKILNAMGRHASLAGEREMAIDACFSQMQALEIDIHLSRAEYVISPLWEQIDRVAFEHEADMCLSRFAGDDGPPTLESIPDRLKQCGERLARFCQEAVNEKGAAFTPELRDAVREAVRRWFLITKSGLMESAKDPRGRWAREDKQRCDYRCTNNLKVLDAEIATFVEGESKPERARSDHSDFPKRAVWLRQKLKERDWNKHNVEQNGGPNHKTVQKILDGKHVYDDSINKPASALEIEPADIPTE